MRRCEFITLLGNAAAVAMWAGPAEAQNLPSIKIASIGYPVAFATHPELERYGFSFGPSDGRFGAIPSGGGGYTFYGAAGSTSSSRARHSASLARSIV